MSPYHKKSVKLPTTQYRSKTLYVLLGLLMFSLVFNLFFGCMGSNVDKGTVSMRVGESGRSQVFTAERSSFLPAYRITTTASFPDNHEISYTVALKAEDGTAMFEFEQEEWRESGTWYEDGYSGRWSESDLKKEFKFQPHKTGRYYLEFEVDEFTRTGGLSTTETNIDMRYVIEDGMPSSVGTLWFASLVLILGFVLCVIAIANPGVNETFSASQQELKTGWNCAFNVSSPDKLCLLNLIWDMNGKSVSYNATITSPSGHTIYLAGLAKDSGTLTTTHKFYFASQEAGEYTLNVKTPSQVLGLQLEIRTGLATLGSLDVYSFE